MFVSCHPTVSKNGPDPSKSFFLILQKSTKKTLFSHIFLQTGFSTTFVHKIPFGNKQKKIKKKKSRPTYPYFFGHVTGNKHIFF